jgi:hypothetical protein
MVLPNVVAGLVCPKVDFISRNMTTGLQKPKKKFDPKRRE